MPKLNRLKKFDKIEVLWRDISSPSKGAWFNVDDYDSFAKGLFWKSTGYFLKKEDNYLFMCLCLGGRDGEISSIGLVESIPIGCIKEIILL